VLSNPVEELNTEALHVSGKTRPYPSIQEYYLAASHDASTKLTYQPGLSNFSSLVLGDDRITFGKSLAAEQFKLTPELSQRMSVMSEAELRMRTKSPQQRRRDYIEAMSVVGESSVDRMEAMMREKLHQRTKTGPFQLRKTFKFFDRDGSGAIDIGEFSRALELMGFQFTDMQILALFGRYDKDVYGEILYQDFVDTCAEDDTIRSSFTNLKLKHVVEAISVGEHGAESKERMLSKEGDDSDDEIVDGTMSREEVLRVFRMLDKSSSGRIALDEFELLLLALRMSLTQGELANVCINTCICMHAYVQLANVQDYMQLLCSYWSVYRRWRSWIRKAWGT
jgi:Ca2+-binding EF-hand superfamily protein